MSAPVLVVGGGIAGCATALGLHRAGFGVRVLEARDDVRGGWFLTVSSNGVRALRALGADEALDGASGAMGSFVLRDRDGAERARRPLGGGDPVAFRYLSRSALVGALRAELARRGVEVVTGARVAAVDPDGARVHTDAGVLSGAFLVGADGVGSVVRGVVDPGCPAPRAIGQRVYYGRTDDRPLTGDGDFHVLDSAAQAFAAIPTPEGPTWWFARVGPPVPEPGDDPRTELLGLLDGRADGGGDDRHGSGRGGGGVAAGLVATSAPGHVGAVDPHDLAFTTTWWRGRAVLVGDAAHAASPATGAGSTMACEDAVVLAKALRGTDPADGDPLRAAFARYQALRRPRCQANVVASAAMSASPVPGADPGDRGTDDELHRLLAWGDPLPAS